MGFLETSPSSAHRLGQMLCTQVAGSQLQDTEFSDVLFYSAWKGRGANPALCLQGDVISFFSVVGCKHNPEKRPEEGAAMASHVQKESAGRDAQSPQLMSFPIILR